MPILTYLESWGRYCQFAGRSFVAALQSIRRPGELGRQLHRILLGALPLGVVAGLAMGVVVWIHLHGVVSAEYRRKVPEYLALAVVLEFAPLGAGLVVAGRSGASLGAELGSMKLTEQLDALEVLGLSPMKQLVGPRVLACMITLPLLTVFIAYVAIGSSFLAEMLGGNLYWTQYQNDVLRGLEQAKAVPATLKTVVFGFLVAVTGCYQGMQAQGGTEGVGLAATRGVVVSTFLVLISNVVLVKLIQLI
ncbi:MAG TPA: ABC transporter permease [Gemmataceae bacterium]|nr:ABC transporter permease [Gemmataceae bacterium]